MKKNIIILAVSFILVFGLGIFIGTKIKKSTNGIIPGNSENTFQAGYEAARKRLQEKGVGVLPAGMEIKSLSGTADKISGNTIVLKNVSTSDPLSDPSLDTRTVKITQDTKFLQLTQKDPQQFQREMEEFQNKMKEEQQQTENADEAQPTVAPDLITPPAFEERKEISLAEIKEGQLISVTAEEDVRNKKEFSVKEISVQEAPKTPLPVPVAN